MKTLPNLPNRIEPRSNQNISLMGINFTDNYIMGELADSYHMTADRYPYMAMKPHLNHRVMSGKIRDIVHFNRLYVVRTDGSLLVDLKDVPTADRPTGTYVGDFYVIGNIGTEPQQFAAIHNRIIIWPAKKIVNTVTFALTDMSTSHDLPDFDYICSAQNRLWGVADNTIFCSKQGEPDVFDGDMGYVSSPYWVEVASEGKFTGCIAFGTAVLFFKEDRVYKLLGETAITYEMVEYVIDGVKDGCHKSMQVINDTLYFMSRKGVMQYNGSYNQQIGLQLGDYDYKDAVGGYDGFHYILSAKLNGNGITFTYDLRKGIWLKDEEVYCPAFGYFGSHFYRLEYVDSAGGLLWTDDETTTEYDKDGGNDWSMTFKPFYETVTGKYNSSSVLFSYKRHSKIVMRVELGDKSTMKVEHKIDDQRWEEVARLVKKPRGVRVIALPITRDDTYQMRISGTGECAILGIVREFRQGAER